MRSALLLGPPGSGKIARARAIAAELPALEGDTLVEHAWIMYGARLADGPVLEARAPFRAPHHTTSEAGICGAVSAAGRLYPGEASLAHGGCLLLDELPEFRASAIGALGCVLRHGERVFWRRTGWITLPARPALLLATAGPCPCGYLGSQHPCRCSRDAIDRWATWLCRCAAALGITEVIHMGAP